MTAPEQSHSLDELPVDEDSVVFRMYIDELLFNFADYIKHHEKTGLGGPNNQHETKMKLFELVRAREAVVRQSRTVAVDDERSRGRPKKTDLDSLWDAIRQSLRNSAMGYMDIPHAQEFQVRATVNIGPLVRDLVDYELDKVLDEVEKRVIGEDESPLDPKQVGPVEYGIGMGRYELKTEQRSALDSLRKGN